MKPKIIFLTGALTLGHLGAPQSWSASTVHCELKLFSPSELNEAYKSTRRVLGRLSPSESHKLTEVIVRKANEEANTNHRPCLADTQSCLGSDPNWNYQKQLSKDSFGNVLRLSGEANSRKPARWPNSYFAHLTWEGYTCAWGGQLPAQCVRFCQLYRDDERFHD